jgi:hypothetical protein
MNVETTGAGATALYATLRPETVLSPGWYRLTISFAEPVSVELVGLFSFADGRESSHRISARRPGSFATLVQCPDAVASMALLLRGDGPLPSPAAIEFVSIADAGRLSAVATKLAYIIKRDRLAAIPVISRAAWRRLKARTFAAPHPGVVRALALSPLAVDRFQQKVWNGPASSLRTLGRRLRSSLGPGVSRAWRRDFEDFRDNHLLAQFAAAVAPAGGERAASAADLSAAESKLRESASRGFGGELLLFAEYLLAAGRAEEALATARDAHDPRFRIFREYLVGKAYLALGHYGDAYAYLTTAITPTDFRRGRFYCGLVSRKVGFGINAATWFTSSLSLGDFLWRDLPFPSQKMSLR